MPDYTITSPAGKKFRVTAPEGATQDQVLDYAKGKFGQRTTPTSPDDKFLVNGSEPNAIERGFLKAGVGTGQILDKIGVGEKLGLPTSQEYSKAGEQLEKQGEGKGFVSSLGETAGNPYNIAGMLLPGAKVANAVLGGAISSLSEPVKDENFATDKTLQGITGAGLGALGGAFAKSLGSLASPEFENSVKLLAKEGVSMTPGTLANGLLKGTIKRGESALSSLPIIGSFMRDASKKSVEDFNKAVMNRALKPVGEKLPSEVAAGRDALNYVESKLSEKYDNILPKLTFKADDQFVVDLRNLQKSTVGKLDENSRKQFANIFDNVVGSHLTRGGKLDGKVFKQVESDLNYEIRTYAKSPDPIARRLGDALSDLNGLLKSNLERMNPNHAKELSSVNSAWAAFTKARGAAATRAAAAGRHGDIGLFSPGELLGEIKKSAPQSVFARGGALMQDLAAAGAHVLPSHVPDSGTTERGLWALLAGGGALAGHPLAATTAAAATIPYTRPGMSVVNKWAQKANYPAVKAVADKLVPAAGVAAASVPQILKEQQ